MIVNELLLDILKRKIESGKISIDDIKIDEYKLAIQEWQNGQTD